MAKEYATRDEVLQAAAKLMYAVQAQGMLAGDKTDLEMAIELAGMIDLTQYVEAGQAEFTAALAKANEVMEDGDAFPGGCGHRMDRAYGSNPQPQAESGQISA